jgi:Methyltransferase domain
MLSAYGRDKRLPEHGVESERKGFMPVNEEIFKTILATRPPVMLGWCDIDKAITLSAIVLAFRPELSVEIGVYGGSSFLPIALAHMQIGKGKAIGIDPWSAEIAAREQKGDDHKNWWIRQDMNKVHNDFMARIAQHKLQPFTEIIRKESQHVEPPEKIGLLHVDGSHVEMAISDMMRFAPKVIMGGICVTDDSDWEGGAVGRGEQRLLEMGFVKLYKLGTGAVFQRIK